MKYPTTFRLETDRCWLRHVSLEDIPHIFSASRYKGFNDGMRWNPPEKEDELITPYEYNVKAWQEDSAYCFTIEEKIDQTFIGRIAIRGGNEVDVWDLGFFTHPEHQGKGFMTEAVEAVIDFGFSRLGASRITAGYAIWNKASEALLKKNGMSFICHMPERFEKNGNWVEVNLLEISIDQWKRRSNQTP